MDRRPRFPRRRRRLLVVPLIVGAVALALSSGGSQRFDGNLVGTAEAARPLDVGFADGLFEREGASAFELRRASSLNADIIRINMYWSLVAYNQPANPRDADDPDYAWYLYDTAIENAVKQGFEVDLTVLAAPSWAEGKHRPSPEKAPYGSWRPNARDYGDFAHALATRYSGKFVEDGRTLPRLRYFEAWNEPNLSTYITPQFKGRKNRSVGIYAKLLNSFYRNVKGVIPKAKIVTGGTAPYGDKPGKGARKTGPLQFARELLCLNKKLRRSRCATGKKPKFDIYAHHPINREDPPTKHAKRSGDVEIADFNELTKVVRKAEKLHTTGTRGRHGLWANEVWWQTKPPDKVEGVPLRTQARWMSQALYLLWKQGASNVSFLQLRDAKYTKGEYTLDSYQTGVYTYGGKPKPSAKAIAFPFVTDRKGKSAKLRAWGIPPRSGKLVIEAKKGQGGYRKLRKVKAKSGKVFTAKVRLSGRAKLRARIGKRKSLPWTQR